MSRLALVALLAACSTTTDPFQLPPPAGAGNFMPTSLTYDGIPGSLAEVDQQGLTVCGGGNDNAVFLLASESQAATPEVCVRQVGNQCSHLGAPAQLRGSEAVPVSGGCATVFPNVTLAQVYPNGGCIEGVAVQGIGGTRSVTTTPLCLPATGPQCGNSLLEAGEACDDGNTMTGDGCDASCQIEVVPSSCTATADVVTTPLSAGDLVQLFYDVELTVGTNPPSPLRVRLSPDIVAGEGAGSVTFDKFVTVNVPAGAPDPYTFTESSVQQFIGPAGPPVLAGVTCSFW
jgi:cysteine-rich repeat protein